MLKMRVIPTLLYKDFGLVKGVQFDSRRHVGSAVQAIRVYNLRDVDELLFFDVAASLGGQPPDFQLIDDLADECFMPLTVGGGVSTLDHVRQLLAVGADKVSLNTALVEHPDVVERAAEMFGTQSVVASIDCKTDPDGGRRVWTHSGTVKTGFDPVGLATRAQDLGAGELVITSIERDGTMLGYDTDMLREVSSAVTIPVVASGGAGDYRHMAQALELGGASAVAAASIFHFTERTPKEAKEYLGNVGYPVRL
jgi:cyclase